MTHAPNLILTTDATLPHVSHVTRDGYPMDVDADPAYGYVTVTIQTTAPVGKLPASYWENNPHVPTKEDAMTHVVVKQASIGAGKWFVTEAVNGVESVVGSPWGYATRDAAQAVADRMLAMIHNPRTCNAFHSAAENVRDAGLSDSYTLTDLDAIADGYVRGEMSECTCGAADKEN